MFLTKLILPSFVLSLALISFAGYAQQAPAVSVVPVSMKTLSPTVMVSGQVQSRHSSELSAGVVGKITWIAEPGTQVTAGDILVQLDQRPFELQVRQLQAQIQRKEIEIKRAEQDLTRLQELHHQQAVSTRDVDDLTAELGLLKSDRELLQLQLEQAQDDLDKTTVKAPYSGVVIKRLQRSGEDVVGTAPLIELVDIENLEIRFHGPLAYSEFARAAESIQVFFSGGTREMQLRQLIPVSDARSQTFTGLLTIPTALYGNFRVGELVTIAVPAAFPAEHFVVPRDALVIGKNGTRVFVVDKAGKATEIKVTIAGGSGNYVNVKGKLHNGQSVVVRGADLLRNGQVVKVLSAEDFPLTTLGS
ncbi:efflux RND transporter periplasmic adaptor subunit [Pseudidiomarina terrestris]|uniref:efflux RND transporter periplasmic adaptor subunit n=1 Tax=Pseudidiomarina terrestris TaxID=2820060 RepID=UPI00264FC10C|nr:MULTISPECIES: efflux RND transporter periplasmic adaptor subunit [unclassified Pseudidiomarina]MDN7135697.1 efflux RND transporter periplasmic adaptor subunit [Pseudidiomarina sp. 1ASP75-5]MDN7137265.1 efflux RND transporter periplasmic adaptor subunit [Pseudidiomarina sp. 1ASP75-14]